MKSITIWIGIGILVGVHVFAGKIKWLQVIPRSRWLSMASGVSVAYVFLHLLPELAKAQAHIEQQFGHALQLIQYLDHHIYLVALAGLAVFYGLERMAVRSRLERAQFTKEDRTSDMVFWIHIVAFAGYNVLIGYLVFHLEDQSARGLISFLLAMALHFLVNDYGLAEHHKEAYQTKGKWILCLAIVLGAAGGNFSSAPEGAIYVALSFLAGGVILNVLKEELPEKRQSRFWAFGAGALAYSIILLAF